MGGYGMTREEEIINAGVEYTESRRPMCIGGQSYSYEIFQMNRNHAFEDGAKWADKTIRERVLDFINTHFYDHPHVNCHICTDSFESLEEMKEELIKAMEE